jgi:hypothetical protein
MILRSAAHLAFAAACLTAIGTLPAHAQTANSSGSASGSYWTSPGAYPGPGTYPAPQTYTPGAYNSAGSGGNAMGMAGPNPGGPPLTPYNGGGYGSTSGTYASQPQYSPPPPAGGMTSGTEVVTNGPQGSPPSNWSAQRNVAESEHYDRLLERNPAFRQARERKECGPITDPQLHQQCLDSFAQYESSGSSTGYGSSSANWGSRSNNGR